MTYAMETPPRRLIAPLRRISAVWTRSPIFVIGGSIVLTFLCLALFGRYIAPYPPTMVIPEAVLAPPSGSHLFGTDSNGMDVFSRVVAGAAYAFGIAVPSAILMFSLGVPLGLYAGYRGGIVDEILLRILDILRAFPSIVLALAVVAATGQSLINVIIVIGFLDAPIFARVVRAEVLSIRRSEFVEAAVAAGNPTRRILFVHLLPNAIRSATALVALRMAWAIRISATLSFIGVGIQAPAPEWGVMIRQGAEYVITGEWWVALFPGLALVIMVLGFNLLGDGLQDVLDPRRRSAK